jgi:SAM-dependent methyltransferase
LEIHDEQLKDVARYIELNAGARYEDQLATIENIFEMLQQFRPLERNSRILEIGVGNGWLQIYGKKQGYDIKGIEISRQLIDLARHNAAKAGVDVDVSLGNIETLDIGNNEYDAIIASSVFEHVERWEPALERVYRALKPGGVFWFDSTNKFSFVSGEFEFPLYGWLPDSWRFKLRRWKQGDDIMKLGIDFNQFTYPVLRRAFKRVGFSAIDFIDFKDVTAIKTGAAWKRGALVGLKSLKPLKHLALTFAPATIFVCIKSPRAQYR